MSYKSRGNWRIPICLRSSDCLNVVLRCDECRHYCHFVSKKKAKKDHRNSNGGLFNAYEEPRPDLEDGLIL